MDDFAASLLAVLERAEATVSAWCVLPNHFHVLIEAPMIAKVLFELGRLHGTTSLAWNREEGQLGRKNFHGAVERTIRSDAHYMATMNYVHHNPVRHGYVEKWTDWPWSSAKAFLQRVGRDTAEVIWKDFPVLDYGAGWDDPEV
jgi:putative transposase